MARPKLGDGETQRLHMKISEEELEAIDDWRFANRVNSRSEAVRRLCQIGLEGEDHLNKLHEVVDQSLTKHVVDIKSVMDSAKAITDNESLLRHYQTVMANYVTLVQDYGAVESALRERSLIAAAFRQPGEMSDLLSTASKIADDFMRARLVIEKGKAAKGSDA